MDEIRSSLINTTIINHTLPANYSNATIYLNDTDLEEFGFPMREDSYFYDGDIDDLKSSVMNTPQFVPMVTLYSIVFILGSVGNGLVIFAMVGDRKSRSVTGSFMVSLAVADLLFLCVCMPYETTSKYFTVNWAQGAVMCKLSGMVEMLSPMTTVLNLLAVSLERYVVIVHPMNARSWCSVENTKKLLPMVWAVALALSCPCLYLWDIELLKFHNNETSDTFSLCADVSNDDGRLVFAVYQLVTMFAIPVIMLTFCYVYVIHVLWLSSRQLKEMTSYNASSYTIMSTGEESKRQTNMNCNFAYEIPPEQPQAPMRHSHIRSRRSLLSKATREHSAEVLRARKQVIKMLIAIIIVFMLCWGPKLTFNLLKRLQLECMHYQWALNLQIGLFILPFVHSCLNPIIYSFMSKNFRSQLSAACMSSWAKCRRTHPTECAIDKKTIASSYYELESRSTNGTVHTKISLRHGSSSNSET